MSAFSWLGLALGVVALLVVFRPLIYLYGLLKVQYRRPEFAPVDVAEVSADLRDYLLLGAEPLFAVGFSVFAWTRYQTMEYSEHGDLFGLILLHEQSGARAWLGPNTNTPGMRINFMVEFADGSRLETAHGESKLLVGPLDGTEVIDTPDPEIAALWLAFQTRLSVLSASRAVLRREPAAQVAATAAWTAGLIDRWVATGVLQPAAAPGLFLMTWRRALQVAWRMGPAMVAFMKFRAARAELEPAEYPLSEQVRMYRRVREFVERRSTRFSIGAVLVVSAALFALSMLRLFDLRALGCLMFVLLFHELGHYGAMRAFGYRDTSIFFIPFFGAAARGIKRDERVAEQVIVLLAGPVPGILLATVLAFAAPALVAREPVRTLADLLVIINVLNLFPIFPFDGGRVVQAILGNAGPVAEVGVRLLGVAALVGLGLFSKDPLVIALSVLMAAGIPAAKRAAVAVRRIRARGPVPQHEDERLALVFDELKVNQPSLPPAKRLAVVLPVAQRLQQGPLGPIGSVGWGGTYVGCFAGGLFAFSFVTLGGHVPNEPAKFEPLTCSSPGSITASLPPGPASFTLRCTTTDEEVATALADSIDEFAWLPAQACLRAPWDGPGLDASPLWAAETRARQTVVALAREWDRIDSPSAPMARPALESYARAHGAEPGFDPTIAELYILLVVDKPTGADGKARFWTLLDKLGRNGRDCSASERHDRISAYVGKDGGVRLVAYRSDAPAGMLDLARFLCGRGCELDYRISKASLASED